MSQPLSSLLNTIKKELRGKGRADINTKIEVRALEIAYIRDNPQCEICGNTNNLTYDHIIPVSILSDFNMNAVMTFWEANSRTLCHACNTKKGHRLDFTTPKTVILLQHLLDKVKLRYEKVVAKSAGVVPSEVREETTS